MIKKDKLPSDAFTGEIPEAQQETVFPLRSLSGCGT